MSDFNRAFQSEVSFSKHWLSALVKTMKRNFFFQNSETEDLDLEVSDIEVPDYDLEATDFDVPDVDFNVSDI